MENGVGCRPVILKDKKNELYYADTSHISEGSAIDKYFEKPTRG